MPAKRPQTPPKTQKKQVLKNEKSFFNWSLGLLGEIHLLAYQVVSYQVYGHRLLSGMSLCKPATVEVVKVASCSACVRICVL